MATLLIVGVAVAIATPLAIAIAVFLSEIAPPRCARSAEPTLQLLAGIPAVVYGFVGYATLVPFMERWLPTGETMLVAAVVLALMVLPFIAATAAEAFSLVARELRQAGPRARREPLVHVHAHHAAQGRAGRARRRDPRHGARAWARRSRCSCSPATRRSFPTASSAAASR